MLGDARNEPKEGAGKPVQQPSNKSTNQPTVGKQTAAAKKTNPKGVQKTNRPAISKTVVGPAPAKKAVTEKPLIELANPLEVSADPREVSLVTSDESPKKQDVGVTELRSFVTQNRPKLRQSAKPQRRSFKEQAILAGVVIGMLALLGAVLVVAMQFAS